MPNGQFHKKSKGPAIEIKNPLSLPVEVTITDSQGFSATRSIRPGREVYIKVPHPGDYDVKTTIIRYDQTGKPQRLGDGGWVHIPQPVVAAPAPPAPGPIFRAGTLDVTDRRWRNVLVLQIPNGLAGQLHSILIEIEGDAEAQLFVQSGLCQVFTKSTNITFDQNGGLVTGQAVTVKARSRHGTWGKVYTAIQGELVDKVDREVSGKRVPQRVTEHKPPKKKEEEVPIRSLGDMLKEFESEEVKV